MALSATFCCAFVLWDVGVQYVIDCCVVKNSYVIDVNKLDEVSWVGFWHFEEQIFDRLGLLNITIVSLILNSALWASSFTIVRVKLKYLISPLLLISGVGVFFVCLYYGEKGALVMAFMAFMASYCYFLVIYYVFTSEREKTCEPKT